VKRTYAERYARGFTCWGQFVAMLLRQLGRAHSLREMSLLAVATNAPLAASIMAIELFGPAVAPCAAISCIVSFLMVGHRSVYPSQILGMAKTRSIRVPSGGEVGDLVSLKTRRLRLRRLAVVGKALRRLGGRLRIW